MRLTFDVGEAVHQLPHPVEVYSQASAYQCGLVGERYVHVPVRVLYKLSRLGGDYVRAMDAGQANVPVELDAPRGAPRRVAADDPRQTPDVVYEPTRCHPLVAEDEAETAAGSHAARVLQRGLCDPLCGPRRHGGLKRDQGSTLQTEADLGEYPSQVPEPRPLLLVYRSLSRDDDAVRVSAVVEAVGHVEAVPGHGPG